MTPGGGWPTPELGHLSLTAGRVTGEAGQHRLHHDDDDYDDNYDNGDDHGDEHNGDDDDTTTRTTRTMIIEQLR